MIALNLSSSGLLFSGIDSQVFLPMITAFILVHFSSSMTGLAVGRMFWYGSIDFQCAIFVKVAKFFIS